jgi:hypothetical protein
LVLVDLLLPFDPLTLEIESALCHC